MMKKIAIAVLLSAFVAAPVFAAGEGPYVGVKVGQSDVWGSSSGWGVYGGYNIPKSATSNWFPGSKFMEKVSWSGEVEYTKLGTNTVDLGFGVSDSYDVTAFGAVLTGTYPINPQFSAIAKAGLAQTSVDHTCSYFGCSAYSTSTFGLRAGIAGQYNVNQKVGLRAGVDIYPDGYHQVSAGAVFTF